jgi:hypothetical protein
MAIYELPADHGPRRSGVDAHVDVLTEEIAIPVAQESIMSIPIGLVEAFKANPSAFIPGFSPIELRYPDPNFVYGKQTSETGDIRTLGIVVQEPWLVTTAIGRAIGKPPKTAWLHCEVY